MFCENCGKKLEDGWKICPNCGQKVPPIQKTSSGIPASESNTNQQSFQGSIPHKPVSLSKETFKEPIITPAASEAHTPKLSPVLCWLLMLSGIVAGLVMIVFGKFLPGILFLTAGFLFFPILQN